MAVDGKKASGRLAAATVLWLFVAIFANQNYVNCAGEEDQQRFQQQQQQQQQFLPPQQQQQQLPPTPQQQQQQLPPKPQQQQLFVSPPPQQQQQKFPSPQQQQQQNLPPTQQQQPQILPQMPPKLLPPSQLPPNLSTQPSLNPDFGTNNNPLLLRPNQQLSNVAGPLNMPGDGRIPGGSTSISAMQASSSSQVPMVDETNQRINPQFRLNSPSEPNINSPSLQTNPSVGQIQFRPPAQLTEQTNNAQESMNNPQNRYSQQHYVFARPPMINQQRPNQQPFYFNGNTYEALPPNIPPGIPGHNMNLGDHLMQPMHMLTDMMPENPLGMVFNTVHKISDYGGGIKDGFSRTFREVAGKVLDHGQSGVQKVFDIGSNGAKAVFDLSRQILIPEPKNQQTGGGFSGRYPSPQQNMPPGYGFNPNQPFPAQMGYHNMQPYTGAGQFMGGNNNGQPPPQLIEYSQQNPEPKYAEGNPINKPQTIVRYGQV